MTCHQRFSDHYADLAGTTSGLPFSTTYVASTDPAPLLKISHYTGSLLSQLLLAWEPLPVLILLSLSLFLQVTLLPLQAGCLLFGRDSTLASAACLNVDFLSRALAFG